jgi:hypothetical protein
MIGIGASDINKLKAAGYWTIAVLIYFLDLFQAVVFIGKQAVCAATRRNLSKIKGENSITLFGPQNLTST